jgi:hypothetical protein
MKTGPRPECRTHNDVILSETKNLRFLPSAPQILGCTAFASCGKLYASSMSTAPYSVFVVLDREFGPRLRQLLELGPIWVVDSAANRDSAQKLWTEFPARNHLNGVTLFKTAPDCSPAQFLIDEMETIDLHHGVNSADPPYTVISVIGCDLNPEIHAVLASFGFNSFNRTEEGFEATRPKPLP